MNYEEEIRELKARVEKLENPDKHENLENHGKITLDEFWDSDEPLAIYCETKKQAEKLCTAFDNMGKRWILGDRYSKRQDLIYAEYCYINDGTWGDDRKELEENFKVYNFEDVIFPDEPKWIFTEGEKVILRNIDKKYEWLARDEKGDLYVYENKPEKYSSFWDTNSHYDDVNRVTVFNSIFSCIKWSDDEPCEFRRYL